MESKIDLRKNVRIHEALTDALCAQNLKELSFEVMFFLFAKISKSHDNETEYTLNLAEFQTLTGKNANLSEYIEAIKGLRKVTFEIETQSFILIDGILSNAKFMKGRGCVVVKISSDMKPFLLELTRNYDEHQLFSVLRLDSKHAKSLYLYLNSNRPKNGLFRTVLESQTIKDFKTKTGYMNPQTGEEIYKKWNHFNERVLKPSKEAINALSNIKVAYYTKKWGRETYWIEWHIENKKNDELIQLDKFQSKAIDDGKTFEEKLNEIEIIAVLHNKYKLDEMQAKIAAGRFSNDRLKEVLNIVDEKCDADPNIKIGGYTYKVMKSFGVDLVKDKKTYGKK